MPTKNVGEASLGTIAICASTQVDQSVFTLAALYQFDLHIEAYLS